jgi:phosphohistidine phosphatase
MPTLVLLRHGKSAYPEGVEDHDRPLSERGEREAPVAGRRLAGSLADLDGGVDVVLVSSAVRAQQTWQLVAAHIAASTVETEGELYLAELDELLDAVHGLPNDAGIAVIVGHNNGLEDFASWLCGVPVTLKTSTYAVITSEQPWSRWGEGSGDLSEVVVAR